MAKFTALITDLFRASESDKDRYHDKKPETDRDIHNNSVDLTSEQKLSPTVP